MFRAASYHADDLSQAYWRVWLWSMLFFTIDSTSGGIFGKNAIVLTHVSISHLAIVEDAQVDFEQGFNVLTGETGAGKSILIGAISLLAGKKASSDSVRQGQQQAYVEGVVELSKQSPAWTFLDDCGIACEDTSVIIKRIISANGKNKVLLNQQVTTVSTLSTFAQYWLDVTGQHAQQKMLDPLVQIDMLDQAGNYPNELASYQEVFSVLGKKKRQLQQLLAEKRKAEEEKEFLTFQYQELHKAELEPGQLETLQNQYSRIKNAKEISDLVSGLYQNLSGESGVVNQLDQAKRVLEKLDKLDATFAAYTPQVEEVLITLQELASESQRTSSSMGLSEREADTLNSRISFLQKLAKKHGSIEHAIEKRDHIKAKLDLVSEESGVQWQLQQEVAELEKSVLRKADILTQKRQKNADQLSKAITSEVRYLGMKGAKIDIVFQNWHPDSSVITIGEKIFHAKGAERIVFMFAPNVGEGSAELAAIASGGEISRVMLAIKSIAIQTTGSFDMTYLFDEVDSGVGGETAERIGQRMHVLASQNAQVLSVTHLAQVAAYADQHAKVLKQTVEGRTKTLIRFLDQKQRQQELARMIGGIKLTKKTFDFATELLEKKHKDALTPGQGQL